MVARTNWHVLLGFLLLCFTMLSTPIEAQAAETTLRYTGGQEGFAYDQASSIFLSDLVPGDVKDGSITIVNATDQPVRMSLGFTDNHNPGRDGAESLLDVFDIELYSDDGQHLWESPVSALLTQVFFDVGDMEAGQMKAYTYRISFRDSADNSHALSANSLELTGLAQPVSLQGSIPKTGDSHSFALIASGFMGLCLAVLICSFIWRRRRS